MLQRLFGALKEMRVFLLLWLSQSFSALGSAMTSYALVVWSYQQSGSALRTALLMICSYAPYVLCSIFAGALSDRWDKKRTMLVCDSVAALTTIAVLALLETGRLQIGHIYLMNAVNGLMNTVQQPASEVAVTRVLPKKYYQKEGGFRYLSSSANSILTPVITTAFLGLFGIRAVFLFDLATFAVAFVTLWLFIRIPDGERGNGTGEGLLAGVRGGIRWLRGERGIMGIILFLAAINLVASMYNAAFPAMMLSRAGGGERVMGIVNAVVGVSTLLGSLAASLMGTPKSRVKVICGCLLFSMSTENFLLAFGRNVLVWSVAGFLGWIAIPLMNANLGALMRLRIPEEMQGRVYSVRNSLQFFTIPIGYWLGGFAVDAVFEPFMASRGSGLLATLFGVGKGSGAALFFFVIGWLGVAVCLFFSRNRDIWALEKEP